MAIPSLYLWAYLGGCLSFVLADLVVPLQSVQTLCKQTQNYSPPHEQYTFYTNQWGADGSGYQCMSVGDAPDGYINETAFSATWTWKHSPQLVHSFPNAKLNSAILPMRLSRLGTLWLNVVWTYGVGTTIIDEIDDKRLTDANLTANVALDMFLDPDLAKSSSTTAPSFEIMVWFGAFGNVKPIGFSDTPINEREVNGTKFYLYEGPNDNGQYVYSWVAEKNLTTFDGDVAPLLHSVINANASGGLQTDDYIGIVEFGTETHHTKAKRPVTFAARMLKMVVTEAADSTPVESPKPSENPKPSDNPKPSGSSAIRYGGKIITPVVLFVVLLVCA